MRNVTLRHLRAVIAIHEHGRIATAAKALGLTSPAVTLQLRQLEEEVGAVLFERTGQGMRPTAAGLAVIDAAQAVNARLRALSEQIDDIRNLRRGRLVIGAVSTAKYFAPRIIAGFARECPDIDIRLLIGNRAATVTKLADRSLDVALMGRPPKELDVNAEPFGEHPLVIIAPPDHPLATARNIPMTRVAAEPLLAREQGSGTRSTFDMLMKGAGDVPPAMEMDSNETIKQAVMAGLGVALLSAHTIASEVEAGRLAILDVEGMPVRRQWQTITNRDRVITPAIRAFLDFLKRRGESFLPTPVAPQGAGAGANAGANANANANANADAGANANANVS